jgi:hypothetical protein
LQKKFAFLFHRSPPFFCVVRRSMKIVCSTLNFFFLLTIFSWIFIDAAVYSPTLKHYRAQPNRIPKMHCCETAGFDWALWNKSVERIS